MKRSGGISQLLLFAFTLALDGEGGLRQIPAALPLRNRAGTDLQERGWAPGPV